MRVACSSVGASVCGATRYEYNPATGYPISRFHPISIIDIELLLNFLLSCTTLSRTQYEGQLLTSRVGVSISVGIINLDADPEITCVYLDWPAIHTTHQLVE